MVDTSSLFPPVTSETWHAMVEKTLKGQPVESLNRETADGLLIAPLYAAAEARPGLARAVDPARPWDIRPLINHPDPDQANQDLLSDLEGGAASAVLGLDPTGLDGVTVGSVAGMNRVLRGVVLEFAPIALDAGWLGPQAADWLSASAKGSPTARLHFHMDPLSELARQGHSPGPIHAHLTLVAETAHRLAQLHPLATHVLASGRVIHEAGGGEVGELAFALSSALAYAKALNAAGMTQDQAFASVCLGLSADTDYFLTIAKFRAARDLWARLTTACGVACPARIEARSSSRMLTRQDAWNNMLRLTAAGFGAAVGGADAISLGAFTDALGLPTRFARRQSRNAQLVLMEEAHIGRVSDPAAGSGYVEALTDQLARAAWTEFQTIEAQGGIIAALTSGQIAAAVATVRDRRAAAGPPKVVGVTAFPPEQDAPVEVETPTRRPVEAPSPARPGADTVCPALAPHRLTETFEAAK